MYTKCYCRKQAQRFLAKRVNPEKRVGLPPNKNEELVERVHLSFLNSFFSFVPAIPLLSFSQQVLPRMEMMEDMLREDYTWLVLAVCFAAMFLGSCKDGQVGFSCFF